MKNTIKLIACLLFPALCRADDLGFVIKGKVSGIISGYVSLVPSHDEAEVLMEKVPERVRIVDGEFTFSGKVKHPGLVELKISTKTVSLFLENTAYTVTGVLWDLKGSDFKGGLLNDQLWEVMTSNQAPVGYLFAHPKMEIAPYIAYFYTNGYEETAKAYDLMTPEAKESYYGREILKRLERYRKAAPGTAVPFFTMTDPAGKKFSVKDMEGKIVVLDFWASWCGPCRAYIPTMREHYKQYKDKGVEFVAVSFDESKDKWREAMKELKMEWKQGIVDGGFEDNSPVKNMFNIAGIPYVIVVDRKGRIAATLDYKAKENLPKVLESLEAH